MKLPGIIWLMAFMWSSVTLLSLQTLSANRDTNFMTFCPRSGISMSSKPDSASIESDSATEFEIELDAFS